MFERSRPKTRPAAEKAAHNGSFAGGAAHAVRSCPRQKEVARFHNERRSARHATGDDDGYIHAVPTLPEASSRHA